MAATGLGRATVYLYVKDHPLRADELKEKRRQIIAAARSEIVPKDDDVPSNPFYEDYVQNVRTTDQKGSYAEQVVILRAMQKGLVHYAPGVAGGKADMMLLNPKSGKVYKVQVKTARKYKWGQPISNLKARVGKTTAKYRRCDFDIYVSYDPRHDRCYVYHFDEVDRNKTHVSVSKEHLERWDKLA